MITVSFRKTPQFFWKLKITPYGFKASPKKFSVWAIRHSFLHTVIWQRVIMEILSMQHIQTLRCDHLPSIFKFHICIPMIPHDSINVITKDCEIRKNGGKAMHSTPLPSQHKWMKAQAYSWQQELAYDILFNVIETIFEFSDWHERGEFGPFPTWMNRKF